MAHESEIDRQQQRQFEPFGVRHQPRQIELPDDRHQRERGQRNDLETVEPAVARGGRENLVAGLVHGCGAVLVAVEGGVFRRGAPSGSTGSLTAGLGVGSACGLPPGRAPNMAGAPFVTGFTGAVGAAAGFPAPAAPSGFSAGLAGFFTLKFGMPEPSPPKTCPCSLPIESYFASTLSASVCGLASAAASRPVSLGGGGS